MAGDWLRIEESMPDKPEVCQIAAELDLEQDSVAGKLIRVWSWASRSCHGDGVTKRSATLAIDRAAGVKGFARAMVNAGWLLEEGEAVRFPNFDRHNSKTAKERGLAYIRKQQQRGRKSETVTPPSRSDRDKNGTIESETKTEPEPKGKKEKAAATAAVSGEGKCPHGYTEAFERAFAAFRKTSRGGTDKRKAFKAWWSAMGRLRRRNQPDHENWVLSRIEAYAASPVGQGEYAKAMASWLNADAFDDDDSKWTRANGTMARASPGGAATRQLKEMRPDLFEGRAQ